MAAKAPLFDRLADLAMKRHELERELLEVRRETGAALVEVRDSEDMTLSFAAGVLDLSRPTVYCLLEDAGGPA